MKIIKEYRKYFIVLIFISVGFRSLATICGKKAALIVIDSGMKQLYLNPWFGLEIIFLALQAISWIIVLKIFRLSFAYPFMSLVYIFNLLAAYYIFNEEIILQNIIGMALILTGVIFISSEKRDRVYE